MEFYFTFENFIYMIGLIACSSIHLRRSKPRKFFLIKLFFSIIFCLSVSLFIPRTSENNINGCLYMSLIRFIQFLLIVLSAIFLFSTEFRYLLTRSIFGNITLFIPYMIYMVINTIFNINEQWLKYVILISLIIISLLIFGLCSFRQDKGKYLAFSSLSFTMIIACVVAIIIAFTESNFINIENRVIIICLLPIIALLSFLVINFCADERRIKVEYDFLKTLHQREKVQYQMSKELIDDINIKFHDIKHQIQNLKKDVKTNQEQLLEIENNITNYESFIRSGNDALDVILIEKNLYCKEKEIKFEHEIDGKLLSYMKEVDIYSLFGNMLDNAIQSTINTDDKFINLKIINKSGAIYIHCDNSFVGEISFKNGLPLTKKNTLYHGFGTKSIYNIVTKYNGVVNFKTNHNIFNVDIILPLNEN